MKTVLSLIVCMLALPAWSQIISSFPGKYVLSTNDVFLVSTPGVATYKISFGTLASNLNGYITVVATVTNAVARGSNLATTNTTSFGVFYQVSGLTNMEFFNLKQGTNMVIYRDGSNIVLNATGTGSGGGGAGSFSANASQFTTNTSLTVIDGASMSNVVLKGVAYIDGLITAAGTNINAFYGSNYFGGRVQIAVGLPGVGKVLTSDVDGVASWEAPTGGVSPTELNTASNFLYTTETTRNGAVSNGVVAFELTRNAAVSNALVALVASSSGSTQVVVAAFGNANVTNTITAQTLSVVTFNASSVTLTNPMGSNQVRLGYQDLTNAIRRQSISVGAGNMISNFTEGATFSTVQGSPPTNTMRDSYVFSGVDTNVVGFDFIMPPNWDLSTMRVKLWTASTNDLAIKTNVWGIAAKTIKSGNVFTNVAWGTEVTITNVVSSAGGQELLSPSTPALTVGNSPSAAGNHVYFRIRRLPGHPDDTDIGRQELVAAWVQWGETMSEVPSW